MHVTDREQLAGLSEDAIESAAMAAKERGLEGYVLTLLSPTIQPGLMTLETATSAAGCSRRPPPGAWTAASTTPARSSPGSPRSGPSVPRCSATPTTPPTWWPTRPPAAPTAVTEMLDAMAAPAMRNLERERAEIEAAMRADGVDGPVQPWDWSYYAAKVKAATYDVDTAALRPYFSLDRVLHDGIFHAAEKLYGLTFAERHDLPAYAPDVRVYEVFDHDGATLGLFICDWFARPTKRGGAWMDEFVSQSHLLDQRPVVVVCLNVPHPAEGQPALMTVDEVRTAFHEFGHALHGLFSDVTYPRISGTSTPRDFVEFPSQVNEMWQFWPEVLANYARHHETGEPLAQDVADRLIAAQSAGMGFDTVAMLGAALLDHEWHRLAPDAAPVAPEDVEEFERAALERHGVRSDLVPPRYRTGYFAHSFTNGYDAGYYSYLWSEVLDADMVDWFTESGGLTRENGDVFRDQAAVAGRRGRPDRGVHRDPGQRTEHDPAAAPARPGGLTCPEPGGPPRRRFCCCWRCRWPAAPASRRSTARRWRTSRRTSRASRRGPATRAAVTCRGPSTCSSGSGPRRPTTWSTSGTPTSPRCRLSRRPWTTPAPTRACSPTASVRRA